MNRCEMRLEFHCPSLSAHTRFAGRAPSSAAAIRSNPIGSPQEFRVAVTADKKFNDANKPQRERARETSCCGGRVFKRFSTKVDSKTIVSRRAVRFLRELTTDSRKADVSLLLLRLPPPPPPAWPAFQRRKDRSKFLPCLLHVLFL